MKFSLITSVISIFIVSACSKSNDKGCAVVDAKCLHKPPTDEACAAAFERWFYQPESNQCTLIAYSGCNVYGFETKQDCEQCTCKK